MDSGLATHFLSPLYGGWVELITVKKLSVNVIDLLLAAFWTGFGWSQRVYLATRLAAGSPKPIRQVSHSFEAFYAASIVAQVDEDCDAQCIEWKGGWIVKDLLLLGIPSSIRPSSVSNPKWMNKIQWDLQNWRVKVADEVEIANALGNSEILCGRNGEPTHDKRLWLNRWAGSFEGKLVACALFRLWCEQLGVLKRA